MIQFLQLPMIQLFQLPMIKLLQLPMIKLLQLPMIQLLQLPMIQLLQLPISYLNEFTSQRIPPPLVAEAILGPNLVKCLFHLLTSKRIYDVDYHIDGMLDPSDNYRDTRWKRTIK